MIELPFGNGVTAALVFLIFELLVLPILVEATSKAASLFSHKLAKNDKSVCVQSLPYPLWNEGLHSRQLSHVLLFLVRIVGIAIPVYLETKLDFRDDHEFVNKRVQNAFVTEPVLDWLKYSKQTNDSIYNLRDQAALVFDRCSYTDDDGWLIASVGNVTYSSRNDLVFINCVNGTGKPIYRTKGELPGEADLGFLLTGELKAGDLRGTISFSFVEGPLPVIQPSFEHDFYPSDQLVFESLRVNVSVANGTRFDCFLPSLDVSHSTFFQFLCHNMSGNVVDYYYIYTESSLSKRQNSSLGADPSVYEVSIGPLDVVLEKLVTLEYRSQVLVTAEHVVNIGLDYSLAGNLEGLLGAMRHIMYTRSDNLSVSVPGDEVSQRTIVDDVVIIIGAIEVGTILVFGLAMQLCFTYRWRHIQRPNTVDGLSQCWARAIAGGERREAKDENVINLRLRKSSADGIERMLLEPVTRDGY